LPLRKLTGATRQIVVYYKGERMGEARLLDAVADDRRPQSKAPAAQTRCRQPPSLYPPAKNPNRKFSSPRSYDPLAL
jgi:hypothetical protein